MTYLFIDTETSGLPKKYSNPLSSPDDWPRLVQIAWIECNENEEIIEESNFIIIPEGFEISESSVRFHGISTNKAIKYGHPIRSILDKFSGVTENVDFLIGHNVDFDRSVIAAELVRANLNPSFYNIKTYCTMKSSTDLCKIKHPSGKNNYKWPNLDELYHYLFGIRFNNPHDAINDVNACKQCFFEMKKRFFTVFDD